MSRFFISQIGQVGGGIFGQGSGGARDVQRSWAQRPTRNVMATEPLKNEARILAHAADLVLQQFEGRYLLFSGAAELRTAVIDVLPKAVQQHLGVEFSVEVHLPPAAVAAAAEPGQRAIEEREELVTVQRLLDAGPTRSAWGVQPTLGRIARGAGDDAHRRGQRASPGPVLAAGIAARCWSRPYSAARSARARRSRRSRMSSSWRSSTRSRNDRHWRLCAAPRRGN